MISQKYSIVKAVKACRNNSNCRIYTEEGEFFICSMDLVLEYGLSKGRVLDEEVLGKIENKERIFALKRAAFSYASYKPRSERQIVEKLTTKKFNEDEIFLALDFLKNFKLLDDEKFAAAFVKDYIKLKPSGKPKVLAELRRKGISQNIAETAVSEHFPEDGSYDLARHAAEKKLRAVSYKPIEKQKNALTSYLQRQGFSWDIIKQIIADNFDKK